MDEKKVIEYFKTEEGERVFKSLTDKEVTKEIETYKQNNVQKLIEQHELSKRDPHEVKLEALEKQLEQLRKTKTLKQMCLEAKLDYLPVDEVVEVLVTLPEEHGVKMLETMESHIQKIVTELVNTEIDSKMKKLNIIPQNINHSEQMDRMTKEKLLSMNYDERVKVYRSNPDEYNWIMRS